MRAKAPGPQGHFLLGSIPDLQRDIVGFLHSLPRQYGDIVRIRLGTATAHLIQRPEHVRHVLLDNYQNYTKDTPGFRALSRFMGKGLLTTDGAYWRRQRRIAQPAFHRQYIEGFAAIMVRHAEELVEQWRPSATSGAAIDVFGEMMQTTLRIAAQTMMGADVGAEAKAIGEAVTVVLHDSDLRLTRPFSWPDVVPTAHNRRFRAARALLDSIVYRMIAERRANPTRSDLLGMLTAARDEETGEGMTDQQLRDEVMTILLSGHETTASALTWTFYLLAKNPAARERLREELATVLSGRPPTTADLSKLKYTTMVLQESMRLYPPAWTVTRRAKDRDEIGGVDIPAGSFLFVSPMVTQRNPEYWPNPETFDPERFAPEALARMPKFAYYPFGGGPRGCIGNAFAMMEAQTVLACVAQRYELDLVPGHPVELEPLVSLRPRHGMRMTLRTV